MIKIGLEVDSQKRARKFIYEVLETDVVYYLKRGNYAEVTESNHYHDEEENPSPIIPFWSKGFLPYARKWSPKLDVQEISLEEFIKYWLKGMNKDGVIVGLNWDQNGIGYECLPFTLLQNLAKAEEGEEVSLENLVT
jgi:hypothetical protein